MSLATEDIKLPDGFERVLTSAKSRPSHRLKLLILKNSKHNITHQISSTDILRHTNSSEGKAANSLNNTETNVRTL